MELLKLLSANEIVAQIISFLLVFTLLRIFVWKHFLKILDDRRDRIASELKVIEDTKSDLAKAKAKYDALFLTIQQAAQEKFAEVMAQGEKDVREIKEKARLDAGEIIEDTKREIKFELARSREDLKERIIELTMQATRSMIQAKLTPEEDRRLIENFLKDVDRLEDKR
ncbi:MAG: ATP synthase F0 subunit B [Candidatus Omnitrophica bacterium CG1_02_44_16]|nr:MAG: ATP synthase F0 subunit B [Candidatus Omnitrophica bacterium CG1_02_44_16]PIY83125.1 MAG: ATP synthase F0 subunit B [Candidatus Omnitrophica bacterium CG_4_10_14_0_8_um_filter_44_12]PIZ83839.1 MAG: ATP synthase F0 subunit B [Candidatus Omnitrophica bacterium CG_4_10_14_0_2_um_filter_44_9]